MQAFSKAAKIIPDADIVSGDISGFLALCMEELGYLLFEHRLDIPSEALKGYVTLPPAAPRNGTTRAAVPVNLDDMTATQEVTQEAPTGRSGVSPELATMRLDRGT